MKLKVKLFGTLRSRFPDYDLEQGLEVEIPDGARVGDLLAHLDISASDGVVVVDGLVVKKDRRLEAGVAVRVLQRGFGG